MFPDYFGVRKLFTIKDLFNARIHLGHTDGTLNSHMRPFIFGSRLGHTVFDLDKTAVLLREALNFTAHIAYRGGIILFVCHYPQHTLVVENAARKAEEFAHAREWDSTILTNSEKVYGGVTRLPDLCILLSTLNTLTQVNFTFYCNTHKLVNSNQFSNYQFLGTHCCTRCSQDVHSNHRNSWF